MKVNQDILLLMSIIFEIPRVQIENMCEGCISLCEAVYHLLNENG